MMDSKRLGTGTTSRAEKDKESKRSDFLSHLVANRSEQELSELGLSGLKKSQKDAKQQPSHYILHAGDGQPSAKEKDAADQPASGLYEIPRDFCAMLCGHALAPRASTALSSTSSPSLFSGLSQLNSSTGASASPIVSTLDMLSHNGVPYVLLGQEGIKGRFLLKGSKLTQACARHSTFFLMY
jgi:hypothetical protein